MESSEPKRSQPGPGALLIRADAGVQTGTGHVMRCLALAQAWARRGGQPIFFLSDSFPAITQRILSEGFEVVYVPATAAANDIDCVLETGHRNSASWAILDGYTFSTQHQQHLLDAGLQVLVIDDYGQTDRYPASIILNHNVYASASRCADIYKARGTNTRLLLGSQYALLRREFLAWAIWKRRIRPDAARLLITLGGSDAANRSGDILRALSSLLQENDIEVVLLVTGAAQSDSTLEDEAAKISKNIRLVHNTSDMPAWMAWADIAAAGAGVTASELCFMGLPALLLVLAKNQRPVANRLTELGAALQSHADGAFDANEFASTVRELRNSPLRAKMSQSGRDLIDGLGADRVCAAMIGKELRLRPLCADDCDLLFRWANDPEVRAVSFHTEPIPRATHEQWFAAKFSDPAAVFHIGEDTTGKSVGQTRYALEGNRAVLSINVDPALKGQGWGRELLYFSTRTLFRERNVEAIDAFVQPSNTSSLRLFEQAGFESAGNCEIHGRVAVHFVTKAPQPSRTNDAELQIAINSQKEIE